MTTEEATMIVSYLNAAFSGHTLEPESFALWVTDVALLKSPDVATAVARAIYRGGDEFPTIHQFRQTYRALAEATLAGTREIEPPPLEPGEKRKRPEWVAVWAWARANGDERPFPQQEGLVDPLAQMSQDDYEELRGRWQAAGSPYLASPWDTADAIASPM